MITGAVPAVPAPVVVVTGGGRGIGRAIARRFAEADAQVAVAARSRGSGEETVAEIRAANGSAAFFAADVADRVQVRAMLHDVAAAFGGIDIVIHNAARLFSGGLADISDDDIDQVLATNVKASFLLAGEALPYLRRSARPRLLYVSSIVGNRIANVGLSLYGASKAALNGLIRHAGAELAPLGIRVNAVEPGSTLTDEVAARLGDRLDEIARYVPTGRLALPDDIAAALLFLAGPGGDHITGQTIIVDGGQSLGSNSGPRLS